MFKIWTPENANTFVLYIKKMLIIYHVICIHIYFIRPNIEKEINKVIIIFEYVKNISGNYF